jgi:hypothetical protein
MIALLSQMQMAPMGGAWSFGGIIIAIIICLGVIGIAAIAIRVMQIPVPQWLWQILAIVVVVCIAVVAIRFLLGM